METLTIEKKKNLQFFRENKLVITCILRMKIYLQ